MNGQPDRGRRLTGPVLEANNGLQTKLFAGIHEMSDGFHRMLVKRFPFAVYYLIEAETIKVYGILDCRRDPEYDQPVRSN